MGRDGLITLDEGKLEDPFIEMKEGMQLDRRYITIYFITDRVKIEKELEQPYALINDIKNADINELLFV